MSTFAEASRSGILGRYRHWWMPLAKLASGQAAGMVLNGLFALIVLRAISPEQFALYTLFSSIQQTIGSFSDMGINGSIVAVGARYRHDAGLFGQVIETVKTYRQRFFLIGIALAILLSSQVLFKAETTPTTVGICLLITAVTAWVTLQNQLMNGVLYLNERFTILGFIGPLGSTVRFYLLVVLWGWRFEGLIALLLINLAAETVNHFVYRWQRPLPPVPAKDSKPEGAAEVRRHVFEYSRPLIAGSVLHYIQPNLVLWVLNAMSSLKDVASFGAVGRFGQVTNFVTYLCTSMVMTRLAKAQNREVAKRLFLKLTVVQFAVVAVVTALLVTFAGPVLLLLGKHYDHLHRELSFFLASWVLAHFSGYFFLTLISRGHSKYQGVINGLAILLQVGFAMMIRIDSAEKAFSMNIFYGAVTLVGQLALVYYFVFRDPRTPAEVPAATPETP